ncbi:hypothetical protein FRC02_010875 [Tulasnella sp. 418]|nr:hypothetical protein FRC02_010875 [Tulasnella sp. 418]
MPFVSSGSIAEGAPLNQAHEHAIMADDLHSLGDLEGAVKEHMKAADEYTACIEYTTDPNLQTTLRRMHMDQQKAAEDLRRRIAQRDRDREINRQHKTRPNAAHRSSGGRGVSGYLSPPSNDDRSPSRTPMQSTMISRRLQDSTLSDRTSGAESFMMLGGGHSEYGDRFNKWWGQVEGLLDKLSQPVALTTAPLAPWDTNESSSNTDTDHDGNALDRTRNSRSTIRGKAKGKEETIVDLAFDADDSSDSEFFMVPPVRPPVSRQPSISGPSANEIRLKEENEKLKAEVEQLRAKLTKTENMIKVRAGQEAQLRDSIMFAKREAQRALVSSTTFRSPAIPTITHNPPPFGDPNPFIPPPPSGTSSPPTPVLQKKIKDLEDELKAVKLENEKQKAQITKFREKWASLKESARKKRSMKDAATISQGVRESIKEEDEEEVSNSVPGHLPNPNDAATTNNGNGNAGSS